MKFLTCQLFPPAFHPASFHHNHSGKIGWFVFRQIKQGKTDTKQQNFLIFFFSHFNCRNKVNEIIFIETAVRIQASLNQIINHIDE